MPGYCVYLYGGGGYDDGVYKMKIIRQITIPVPLPTWNRLLGVDRWKRKKIRDMIHDLIHHASKSDEPLTVNQLAGKGWNYVEYYRLIGRKVK